jgi:hypothetical protein
MIWFFAGIGVGFVLGIAASIWTVRLSVRHEEEIKNNADRTWGDHP